jgi:hypothetical protein
MAKPSIPYGWTTTVTVCDNCAAYPTTITLTKPITTYLAASAPMTTATIYATKINTITVQGSTSYSTQIYPVSMTTYSINKSTPAAPVKYVSSIPVAPVIYSSVPYASVPYASVPYVSVVNATAVVKPNTSSANAKPVYAAGTGTPAYAAPYAKYTGAGAKESVSVIALFGALFFAIVL